MSADIYTHPIRWKDLTLDEAWRLRHHWDETSEARLTWLAQESGQVLTDDESAMTDLWRWFSTWADDPIGLGRAPEPVWWAPPVADSLAYRRQVGVEAMANQLERICWTRHPELVPAVGTYPKRRKIAHEPHEPGLHFTPESETGLAWNTAAVVRACGWILNDPEPRRLEWWLGWYEAIDVRVERFHQRLRRGGYDPVVADVEALSAEEIEDTPGFRWLVSFEKEVENDHEGLVEAYANALTALDGVDQVEYFDRGMIRVAGPVGVRKLRSWSKKWLAEHTPR